MRQADTPAVELRNFSVRLPKQEADDFEALARSRERKVAAEIRRLIRRELADVDRANAA